MTDQRCEKYFDDPDLFAEHAESCETCRERLAELDRVDGAFGEASVAEPSIARQFGELPVAPWEAAQHRSWGIAIGAAAVLIIFAAVGFVAAGIPPLTGFEAAFRAALAPGFNPVALVTSVAALVRKAPVSFHITIAIAFVVVNAIFFALLKRAPRGGYDA